MKHLISFLIIFLFSYMVSACGDSSSVNSTNIHQVNPPPSTTENLEDPMATWYRQSHPRTLLDKERLELVINRMYGPNQREPYSRWFKLIKDSEDNIKPVSLVDLSLIYKATKDPIYKEKFIKRIPSTGVPSLGELYAIDIMFDELSDDIKANVMQRVAESENPWYWGSLKQSQGTLKATWGYHDAYGVAPAYAYSAIFSDIDSEIYPFDTNNFLKVVDEQLSASGYFFNIENRIAGDSTYNDALPGDFGGMYDNFGYDAGEESYSLYLFLQHFNLTGETNYTQALHDKYRAHFYQNMSVPHKVNKYTNQQWCRKANTESHLMVNIWDTQTSYTKQPAHNTVTANTFLYKDPKMQYYANNGVQREFCGAPYSGMYWDLIYYDDTLVVSPPSENDTATYFNGPGLVSMRSDWSDEASFAVFMAGEGISRRYEDANSFLLSRKVDVIVNAGARIRFNADNNKHFWYAIRSASKNTMKIMDPDESFDINADGTTGELHSGVTLVDSDNLGGQIHELPPSNIDQCYNTYQSCDSNKQRTGTAFPLGIYETANIIKYEHVPDQYTYSVGDATAAYTKKIDFFEREFLYIRPDVFVIFDRVKSVNPNFKKIWTIHTVDQPVVEAEPSFQSLGMNTYNNQYETSIENPKNNTYIDTLLPKKNNIIIRGGDTVLANTNNVENTPLITLDIPRWLEVFVTGNNTKGTLIISGETKDQSNDSEEIVFDGRSQEFYNGTAEKISKGTLTDKEATWQIDQWVGYQVTIIDGSTKVNYPIEGNIENTLFGNFPELTNRRYIINKAIANSYKHWKQIKSIKNVDLDIDNMTISVPHYFDTVDAQGRLHSFSPHTDFKDDNYHNRKDLGRWTLEIEATEPKLLDNFLNIISLRDPGTSKPKSKLIESEQAYGAIIDNTLVVFAKDRINLTSLKLEGEGKIEDVIMTNLRANTEYYITYKEIGLNWSIDLALSGHEKNKVISSAMGIINFNSAGASLSRTNKPY
ncbi:hypothetical protein Q4493_04310 [Colwellia sp. 1_MG-2023]|uniref:hypothetical protein n=1 Tax=Colwellia sp. 1_MG-2023 TaxID=3062649 RepID=UPI0026E4102C|nr:hypothetical protein [Colwellia sp. 1_MG-2023]MDO6444993.1 hypothetical protein [Colwellia sp. 1_MG-2023]